MHAIDSTDDDALLCGLQEALQLDAPEWAQAALEPMADKGLAHRHVRLAGSGLIARLPKHSQMGWSAAFNLEYQAACFQRAAASDHVPACRGRLQPSPRLPRGGLLIDEVRGRAARLPDDLERIAEALAAIHSIPLPPPSQRAPLLDPDDSLAAVWAEISTQAGHLDAAALEPDARHGIEAVMQTFVKAMARSDRPPRRLTLFDAHPGNFLIGADGRAVLVDLEKARYSHPPLDLAHATLYTSTTWDVDCHAELTTQQVLDCCATWMRRVDGGAESWRGWLLPLRSAMWLWSVTWCAKWRVLAGRDASASSDGEDLSSAKGSAALAHHVRGRVDLYLAAATIDRVRTELQLLDHEWAR